jgi:hypothetical protein
MNHISATESYCQYLFGQEADQIFNHSYLSKTSGVDKGQFIDRCLELAIRVNVYLFTHQEAIVLLDPRAFNKQCQLYALRACQIQSTYYQKNNEEKMAKTEENRFLHLAFFINYAFREKVLYVQTVFSTLRRMGMKPFDRKFTRKHFTKFLMDEDRSGEKASRLSFNQVFEHHTKTMMRQLHDSNPLKEELSLLASEDLQIDGTSLGVKVGKLYTYPKLAGLAYMVDATARENIPIVFKIKVVNQHGTGGMISYSNKSFNANDPVIIFAGFATDGSCSVLERMEETKKCPSYLYRHPHPKKRHPLNAKCFYCTPIKMDLSPHRERLKRVIGYANEFLFALGAEFMLQEQTPLLQFFQNPKKYPQLTRLFETSLAKRRELELDTGQIRSLAIYHTYTETGKSAATDEFALDSNPAQFLLKKGIISPKPSKLEAFCKEQFLEFCAEQRIENLSRAQRKKVMSKFEETLHTQGFNIKSKKDRFPKSSPK